MFWLTRLNDLSTSKGGSVVLWLTLKLVRADISAQRTRISYEGIEVETGSIPAIAFFTKSNIPRSYTRLLPRRSCCAEVARLPDAPGTLAARIAKLIAPADLYSTVVYLSCNASYISFAGLRDSW